MTKIALAMILAAAALAAACSTPSDDGPQTSARPPESLPPNVNAPTSTVGSGMKNGVMVEY